MNTTNPLPSRTILASLALSLALPLAPSLHAAVLRVPQDQPTLQAAINAARSGDEILVAAGVYTEQAVINRKNLTLTGAPGAVLRAWPEIRPSVSYQWYLLVEVTSADVVVRGFEFQGERIDDVLPLTRNGFAAVKFAGAGHYRLEDCRIQGFRGTNTMDTFHGAGLVTWNPLSMGGGLLNLEVRGNTFIDNGASVFLTGDWMSQPSVARTSFLVESNAIHGIGLTTVGIQDGILVAAGAGGTISGNRITDHFGPGTSPLESAYGIVAYDMWGLDQRGKVSAALQPIRIEGNTLVGNQVGIGLALGNGSVITGNSVEGPGIGVLATGKQIDIRGNRLENLSQGLLLVGNYPGFGTILGLASDVRITANRFCDVTTPVDAQPLTTGITQQGTQLCPFPVPSLGIASATLIFWPDDGERHTLEAAPDAQGPWSTVDAIAAVDAGKISFVVTAERSHRFFRLRQ